jgi:hypothetical protein
VGLADGRETTAREPDWNREVELSPNLEIVAVRRAYRIRRNDIVYCAERSRTPDAALPGEVRVVVKLSASGAVTDVAKTAGAQPSTKVEECLLDRVSHWQFGPTRDGRPGRAILPLVL